eukprot:322570-Pyramimonas_sp.AAC.1
MQHYWEEAVRAGGRPGLQSCGLDTLAQRVRLHVPLGKKPLTALISMSCGRFARITSLPVRMPMP